jgi:hypothetical protein
LPAARCSPGLIDGFARPWKRGFGEEMYLRRVKIGDQCNVEHVVPAVAGFVFMLSKKTDMFTVIVIVTANCSELNLPNRECALTEPVKVGIVECVGN